MSPTVDEKLTKTIAQLRKDIGKLKAANERLIKQHERDSQALARAGFALADCHGLFNKLAGNVQRVCLENDELGLLSMKVTPEDGYQRAVVEIWQLVDSGVNKNE